MDRLVAVKKEVSWKKRQIDDYKKEIKEDLDRLADAKDKRSRLHLALKKVGELEESHSPQDLLKRFIYIITALSQHQKVGGLSRRDVKRLAYLASVILQTNGVKPISSKLSFLYGELHLVLSQIHRKSGEQWDAAWEQQMASHLSKKAPVGDAAFQALAAGIRLLRLGHGTLSLWEFERAEQGGLPHHSFMQARLGRIKTLRLAGRLEEAEALIAETARLSQIEAAEMLELQWESMWVSVARTQDLSQLINAVRLGGTHRDRVYMLETHLAIRSVETRAWFQRLPTIKTMARNKKLKPQKLGFFYQCALEIETCYEFEIPFATRLRNLGSTLKSTNQLISVDKELLVWASSARWLARSHSFSLAAICLCEYRNLSMSLSDGANVDALGILADLSARNWYTKSEAEGGEGEGGEDEGGEKESDDEREPAA